VRLSYTENTEPSRIETIFNDGFIDTMGGWVANGSTNPSLVNGRVRVNVNSPWEGLRNQLEDLEVTPGDKYTVQVKFDKGNTQSNIRFYIQEFDANGSHLRRIGLSWNLQTGEYNYNYTVGANAKKIYLRIDKSNTNTSSQTQFYLDNVTLIKGEAQTVFSDGFDSMTVWDKSENSFGWALTALDNSKKRSGSYSGRIDANYPAKWATYVYSDTWVAINNAQDTDYTFSGWTFVEDTTGNSARMFLATRKAGETGYPSGHYDTGNTNEKGKWVYLERSITVPADVKELNIRIDNNKDGKVWFDDVKIVKGNSAKTTIVEESNYYPFGLKHKGYNNVVSSNGNSTAQKFGYNGKELNEELGLNMLDYGARNYDAALGRFMSPDPYAHIYQSYSPYLYALNNPLRFEDVNGEGPGDRVKKAKSYNDSPYSQNINLGAVNRTSNTAAGLKYLDCSELVYRVLAADGITNGVQLGDTSDLKNYFGNDEKFIKSQSPEVGDIFLWRSSSDGHTGVVTGIIKDEDGKIIKVEVTHAKSVKDGTLTEEKAISYFSENTRPGWQGFFRPKVETPDGKISLSGLSVEEKMAKITKAISNLKAWTEKVLKKQEERARRIEERRKRREERRKRREENK
jgi:RHS repeat-associated protein